MLEVNAFSIVIAIYLISGCSRATATPPKIAVVGAGIGGTSVSYFLKDLFGEGNVILDVFEAREVGGRLATMVVGGQKYETGGSVIHPDNIYMAHFAKKFGLPKKGGLSGKFALYDGKKVFFSGSDWDIVTLFKMLWRYGWNTVKLYNNVEKMLFDFKRIYLLQDKKKSYISVKDLLKVMNPSFVEDLQISSEKGFADLTISNLTINEVIMAGLVVNYGQTTAAHKFVGSVSSAAGNGHLWAIVGGNKQVPEMLLKSSEANLIKAKVKTISFMQDSGKYSLSYVPNGDIPAELEENDKDFENETENNLVIDQYDIVIIAAPLTSDTSDINFQNFPSPLDIPEGKYHRTVCTLVKGEINNTYFGLDDGLYDICSIKGDLKINSVGQISDVWQRTKSEDVKVYKVFSQKPLTDQDLSEMFTKMEEVKVVDWLAYPHYDSVQKVGSFVLHENLFHINAIEWAASAMEMSVIGAKNVALLAHKSWTGGYHFRKPRDEL